MNVNEGKRFVGFAVGDMRAGLRLVENGWMGGFLLRHKIREPRRGWEDISARVRQCMEGERDDTNKKMATWVNTCLPVN